MSKEIEQILENNIPSSVTCHNCHENVDVVFDYDKLIKELEAVLVEKKIKIATTVIDNVLASPYLKRQP